MVDLHTSQERMEELCCLSVLGELSAEEGRLLDEHLSGCHSCRQLVREYEQISAFDLAALNVGELDSAPVPNFESSIEERLLDRVLFRARELDSSPAPVEHHGSLLSIPDSCSPSLGRRLKPLLIPFIAASGWAAAAAATLFVVSPNWKHLPNHPPQLALHAPTRAVTPSESQVRGWNDKLRGSEERYEQASSELNKAHAQFLASQTALAQARAAYDRLSAEKSSLESQVRDQKQTLEQATVERGVMATALEQQNEKAKSLEAQLEDVNSKLITQRSEIARLQEVSATASVHLPTAMPLPADSDLRELFGARDLHIVDVYDVDSGKPSRTYGRVYYVNHRLLVFYAFDLGVRQRERKAVAFQAWGFKQPDSSEAENLGLFYMDDSKLDRWVLRVSDPKVLSNIDTLFVTVEPPGGSNVPKGKRLLLASLSGPANHP